MENAIYEGTATFDDFRNAYFAAADASFHIFGIYSTNAADLAGNALFSDSDFGTVVHFMIGQDKKYGKK